MTVPTGSYPEQPPSSSQTARRRPYTLRTETPKFLAFERAVLDLAVQLGRRVSVPQVMEGLCELAAIDRPFQGMVAQHLTRARSLRKGTADYKTTVSISGAAGDALGIAVTKLAASVGQAVSINDTMEALAQVVADEPRAARRLIQHLETKRQRPEAVAAALDSVVAGIGDTGHTQL